MDYRVGLPCVSIENIVFLYSGCFTYGHLLIQGRDRLLLKVPFIWIWTEARHLFVWVANCIPASAQRVALSYLSCTLHVRAPRQLILCEHAVRHDGFLGSWQRSPPLQKDPLVCVQVSCVEAAPSSQKLERSELNRTFPRDRVVFSVTYKDAATIPKAVLYACSSRIASATNLDSANCMNDVGELGQSARRRGCGTARTSRARHNRL